jgi:predicted DNA-binding transcriptional regulator YafY
LTQVHGDSKKKKLVSFEVLKNAIWKENKLKIVYQRADGKTDDRIVEPLGLVAKGNLWYFIASKENGEIRNYRLHGFNMLHLLMKHLKEQKTLTLLNTGDYQQKPF